MNRLFTILIVSSMFLGVAVGGVLHFTLDPDQAAQAGVWFKVVTDVFLRLIKMIIAPLVFSTLVAGIAHMGDAASVGRVGAKTMGWFITASIFSLLLGLAMVHVIQPGVGMNLPMPDNVATGVDATKLTLQEFILHVFPSSIFDAMAKNEILQIVVFSIFVGVAVAALDDKAPAILTLVEQLAAIMLKVTNYVMKLAPLAIFAALAGTVTKYGLEILGVYAKFIGGFYVSLALLWVLLALAGLSIVGPRIFKLFSRVWQPTLLAFGTASSEAAYPRTLEELQKFGVSKKVASFVLPLGYSFNLDGSMMYCTFATLFIAQIFGVEMSIGQQITMLLLLMVTSKGMAGVPRASLVVIAATLAYFDLPEAGIALILAVDHLLDMGRSATNVVGNSVAAAVVAKWEGQLGEPEPEPEAVAASK